MKEAMRKGDPVFVTRFSNAPYTTGKVIREAGWRLQVKSQKGVVVGDLVIWNVELAYLGEDRRRYRT